MPIRYLKKKVAKLIQKIGLGRDESVFKGFFEDKGESKFCDKDFQMECGCKMIFIDGMMSDREIKELYKGREKEFFCEKHLATQDFL